MGVQFPLCFRCSGIYLGLIFTLVYLPARGRAPGLADYKSVFVGSLFACLLLGFDVYVLQAVFDNNASRLITGVLAGYMLAGLLYRSIKLLSR